MDTNSRNPGVSGRLSNFTFRPFIFDGVECNSMEGLLQSFKFKEFSLQKHSTLLIGYNAKKFGNQRDWQNSQSLWWKNVLYTRMSKSYQLLLDFAYEALYTNNDFKEDLLSTKKCILTHSIGKSNKLNTILTEKEFCDRLYKLRSNNCLINKKKFNINENLYINEQVKQIINYNNEKQKQFIS